MDNKNISSALCGLLGGGIGAFAANQLKTFRRESQLSKKYKKCQDIRKILVDNSERDITLEKMGCSDKQLLQILEKDM